MLTKTLPFPSLSYVNVINACTYEMKERKTLVSWFSFFFFNSHLVSLNKNIKYTLDRVIDTIFRIQGNAMNNKFSRKKDGALSLVIIGWCSFLNLSHKYLTRSFIPKQSAIF